MKVSPSSLKLFLNCERAWWLKYVQRVPEQSGGTYLQKGRDYDLAVQAYVKSAAGTTELAEKQLAATRAFLPRGENVLTQVKLSRVLNDEGDILQGTTDIVVADTKNVLVIDTKTTAGEEWALTKATLRLDPQCLIYAYLACLTYSLDRATMRWVYADKRPNPRGWAVEVEITLAEATEYVDRVVRPAVERMQELEASDEQTEAAVEYASCPRCWVPSSCSWWLGRETRPAYHLKVVA